MSNKNVYHIPVDLIKSQTFKIEAENQAEAVKQLVTFLNNHKATKNMFNEFNIKDWDIECDKDDEMI